MKRCSWIATLLTVFLLLSSGCGKEAALKAYQVTFDVEPPVLTESVRAALLEHAVEAENPPTDPIPFSSVDEMAAFLGISFLPNAQLCAETQTEAPYLDVFTNDGRLLLARVHSVYETEAHDQVEQEVYILLEKNNQPEVPAYQSIYNSEKDMRMETVSMKNGQTAYLGSRESEPDFAVAEFCCNELIYVLNLHTAGSTSAVETMRQVLNRYQ